MVALVALIAGCWRNAPEPEAAEPSNAQPPYELHVTAQQWICEITYPNGTTNDELHVPLGRTVRLVLASKDVDHDVEIDSANIDVRVEPGRTATVELHFSRPGRSSWKCPVDVAPGRPEASAIHPIFIDRPDAFARYLARFAEPTPTTLADRIALGRTLFQRKGCLACHSIDGSRRVGPSLAGMWGSAITLADGTQHTIDEAVIRNALRTPPAWAPVGYPPVMPSYAGQLTEVETDALVQAIRSLHAP